MSQCLLGLFSGQAINRQTAEALLEFLRCLSGHVSEQTIDFDLVMAQERQQVLDFLQCDCSGLITGVRYYEDGDYIEIDDLAPAGHQFLANVRQDNIWNNTKTIAGKVGSKSLDALIQISSNVITELIKAQFCLT